MKFCTTQSDLASVLTTVQKAVSTRSTLPILSSVLLQAQEGKLVFSSTDLEIAIQTEVPSRVDTAGSAAIPARLFGDIVRNLPEDSVEVSSDPGKNEVSIGCQSMEFRIRVLPPEEFPRMPDLGELRKWKMPADSFREACRHVLKAVSHDETRPVLTGVLLVMEKDVLKMVATDSYRLAIKETPVEAGQGDIGTVVVPSRAIEEAGKIAAGGDIEIGVTENQVVFQFEGTTIMSRLIEGQFPKYQQLLPESYEVDVQMFREEVSAAVRRVALLAQNNLPIRLVIGESSVKFWAETPEVGRAAQELEAATKGDGIEVAFNAQYLLDGLMSTGAEKVLLRLTNPLKPGILQVVDDPSFLYLIMPVRLS